MIAVETLHEIFLSKGMLVKRKPPLTFNLIIYKENKQKVKQKTIRKIIGVADFVSVDGLL